jgi:hypothetical protein
MKAEASGDPVVKGGDKLRVKWKKVGTEFEKSQDKSREKLGQR